MWKKWALVARGATFKKLLAYSVRASVFLYGGVANRASELGWSVLLMLYFIFYLLLVKGRNNDMIRQNMDSIG